MHHPLKVEAGGPFDNNGRRWAAEDAARASSETRPGRCSVMYLSRRPPLSSLVSNTMFDGSRQHSFVLNTSEVRHPYRL